MPHASWGVAYSGKLAPASLPSITLRGMAAELTKRKIATQRSGRWYAETVGQVVEPLDSASALRAGA